MSFQFSTSARIKLHQHCSRSTSVGIISLVLRRSVSTILDQIGCAENQPAVKKVIAVPAKTAAAAA